MIVEFNPYILEGSRQEYLLKKAVKLKKALQSVNRLIAENQQEALLVR